MTIRFKCPHCTKSLSVKDEYAGKKGTCPACKKGLTIPAPVPTLADLEALAAATFTEQPAAAPAAKAETKVRFTCPFCDAPVEVDAELAGRQSPCPECRRIVKVPQLVKNQPVDWRRPTATGPSGARREAEPAPEGAWGSSPVARGVSEEALLEAGVLTEEREPWTRKQKVLLGSGIAVAAVLIGAGLWIGSYFRDQSRQNQAIQRALNAVAAEKGKFKLGWEQDAAIHLAAGEFYLRTGKPDCVTKARERFNNARTLLVQSGPAEGDEAPRTSTTNRDLLLAELAMAQVELGGDEEDVEKGRRLKWEDAQRELGQTLGGIGSPEIRAEALRAVVRRLLTRGQEKRVRALAARAGGATHTPLMLAIAGTELLRAERTALAQDLAQEAVRAYHNPPPPPMKDPADDPPEKPEPEKKPETAPEKPALPAALVALVAALGRRDLEDKPGDSAWTVGQAAGLARRGELAEARGWVTRLALPGDRLRALVGIAAAALDRNEPAAADIDEAAREAEKLQTGTNPAPLLQLIDLGIRAGQTERMAQLANALRDPDLKAWAQLEVLRAKLAATQGRADEALADTVEKNQLAHALARQAVARHNARHDGKAPGVIDSWDDNLKPFGYAGAALGMQDRSRPAPARR